jgi:ice-binding like protein
MITTRLRSRGLLLSATTLTLVGLLAAVQTVAAAGPATVGLGTAKPFAVLAGTPKVASTGATVINGNLGISPAAAVTGFPPGIVHGTVHKADAVALQAQSDLTAAYTNAAGRPVTATHGTLGGLTLAAGVYNAGGVVLDLTGTLTLDGQNDPSSVWIFQATSALVTASSSKVKLINGASSCRVFWQVTSSATLGSGSTFVGTIMALTSITINNGVTVHGRALARNGEVSLINDRITSTTCFGASGGSGGGPTPPNTGTVPPTDVPGTVPSSVLLVGIFLVALFLTASRRAQRARAGWTSRPGRR